MVLANGADDVSNPIDPTVTLDQETSAVDASEHPQKDILAGDSAMTRAEKIVRHNETAVDDHSSPRKRVKLDHGNDSNVEQIDDNKTNGQTENEPRGYVKGIVPIKAEFLIDVASLLPVVHADDDAQESKGRGNDEPLGGRGGKKSKGGQNTARNYGSSRDTIQLCKSRDHANESDPRKCPFGEKCRLEHDIRRYLREGKREDLSSFNAVCPLYEATGACDAGWRCRWANSHSQEVDKNGKPELINLAKTPTETAAVNIVDASLKISLRKKQYPLPKSEKILKYYDSLASDDRRDDEEVQAQRAADLEPPLRPSEKRRIYYGPETPTLAPLTTQGNLPFRQLCVSLGAQVTFSEMAMGVPLLQGDKGEWALLKAHASEMTPPKGSHDKDFMFGAQIAGNKPWLVVKATEAITSLCPSLRVVDLNCGCPIDLVFKQGAGSALMDSPGKLEKMLRGMNLVSGDVPISVKIRTGVKDNSPTADRLCERLILGGSETQQRGEATSGVAAITLHGRSRQQRYTKSANWAYIADVSATIARCKDKFSNVTDTVREPDARDLSSSVKADGMPYFLGNGDIYSHEDYFEHINSGKVDAGMIGRGALIKPWLFEEIQAGQYLDKTATERLAYIDQFCRNGLAHWGSDEIGVGNTRRYLLEWLSFSCRYVPIGIMEHLPPRLGDRPPAFKGRDEMETLLSSANYKDWIKISEMYLGKAHPNFHFEPKHKSNSYEIEAEG